MCSPEGRGRIVYDGDLHMMIEERRRRVIDDGAPVDWKNVEWLRRFLSDQGRMLPRRMTGTSQQRQREIARAIKRARHMALLPFVGSSEY
jgi:small subunit ribosomal protein S18